MNSGVLAPIGMPGMSMRPAILAPVASGGRQHAVMLRRSRRSVKSKYN